jgi:hypothetical protein
VGLRGAATFKRKEKRRLNGIALLQWMTENGVAVIVMFGMHDNWLKIQIAAFLLGHSKDYFCS